MMVHCEDGRVSTNFVIFLFLTHFTGAQSQVFGPRQVVIATVGDDVVLPCQLDPPQDAVSMTIEWGRPDLTPRFVHVWYSRQDLLIDQNEAFKGRTSLSTNMMNQGDVSLRLSTVKISDNGNYRCYVSKLKREHFVDLLVGSASSPLITLAGTHEVTEGVILQCESGGWYPKPELLWLDSEGDLLPAGPPETLRGPDDLYTVSSRVTVEKRSNITCRVQQKETNQIRETHFLVPDFFKLIYISTASIAFTCVLVFLLILSVGLLVWKWKQKQTEIQKLKWQQQQQQQMEEELCEERDRYSSLYEILKHSEREEKQLRNENQRLEEELLAERKRAEEELEMKEEKLKDLTLGIDALKTMMKGLKEQKQKLREQSNKMDELIKKNEETVTSLEEEGTEKEVKRILEKKEVEKQKDEMKKHQEELDAALL